MTDREKQIKAFTLLDEPCPKCAERRSLGVGEKCPDCKPDHIPGVRKKVEPTEKPESEFTDACDRLEALKVELEQRLGIIRTQEEILKRWGEEFNGLTYRFNIVKSDNEQLAAKLDAEGFRFREQKQISKELQAKLAEANGVIEMLKEKGIG